MTRVKREYVRGAAGAGGDDAVEGNSAGAEHSAGYFAALATTRMEEEEEEEEAAGAHPSSTYEEEMSTIMGAASINSGVGQPQLRPQQPPVSRPAKSSTMVLHLQRFVDMRLESEGVNASR